MSQWFAVANHHQKAKQEHDNANNRQGSITGELAVFSAFLPFHFTFVGTTRFAISLLFIAGQICPFVSRALV